jgi:hypothetical protein
MNAEAWLNPVPMSWLEGGNLNSRVIRGGSWFNFPRYLRSAVRLGYSAGVRYLNNGFRLARTLESVCAISGNEQLRQKCVVWATQSTGQRERAAWPER